ncbi:hypothetical protein QAD02_021931 [Eretmocerus hayati]|uniref:Uncharacterized protein n=1 Tax=Eretmocerus hayati TaxID=131215 RepID=A0ACC2PRV8_9HYME|nr:hypothetical protein QAD02_021931 [Eretmocerus hayati]
MDNLYAKFERTQTVQTHLKPVLTLVRTTVPNLKRVNFRSDGPTTQYRTKTNFSLFEKFREENDLKSGSWNFSAPGHGKSVADGTGDTVKGLCDLAVACGKDITTAVAMVDTINCSGTKVKGFLINQVDFDRVDSTINPDLKAAPNTMKTYQLVYTQEHKDCSSHVNVWVPCDHFALHPHKCHIANSLKRQTKQDPNPKGNKVRKIQAAARGLRFVFQALQTSTRARRSASKIVDKNESVEENTRKSRAIESKITKKK